MQKTRQWEAKATKEYKIKGKSLINTYIRGDYNNTTNEQNKKINQMM